MFNVNLEYRFRGMQASMLYLRENHDDGTFDLSNTLGVLNSQRIAFNGSVNPLEALKIDLGVTAEMALSELKAGDEEYDVYNGQVQSWWTARRFDEEDTPLFNRTGGAEFTFKPAVRFAETVDSPEGEHTYRLGGNSCLSGDFIGYWRFDHELEVGENVIFEDMLHYTTVKTTMFNGIGHPAILLAHADGELEVLREYSYEDYRDRMD